MLSRPSSNDNRNEKKKVFLKGTAPRANRWKNLILTFSKYFLPSIISGTPRMCSNSYFVRKYTVRPIQVLPLTVLLLYQCVIGLWRRASVHMKLPPGLSTLDVSLRAASKLRWCSAPYSWRTSKPVFVKVFHGSLLCKFWQFSVTFGWKIDWGVVVLHFFIIVIKSV